MNFLSIFEKNRAKFEISQACEQPARAGERTHAARGVDIPVRR
jgi:hypothetical protein